MSKRKIVTVNHKKLKIILLCWPLFKWNKKYQVRHMVLSLVGQSMLILIATGRNDLSYFIFTYIRVDCIETSIISSKKVASILFSL